MPHRDSDLRGNEDLTAPEKPHQLSSAGAAGGRSAVASRCTSTPRSSRSPRLGLKRVTLKSASPRGEISFVCVPSTDLTTTHEVAEQSGERSCSPRSKPQALRPRRGVEQTSYLSLRVRHSGSVKRRPPGRLRCGLSSPSQDRAVALKVSSQFSARSLGNPSLPTRPLNCVGLDP